MIVILNFKLPAGVKNKHVTNWMVTHHHNEICLNWDTIPEPGELVVLETENGKEVAGRVQERIWSHSFARGALYPEVYIKLEVVNANFINGPLW